MIVNIAANIVSKAIDNPIMPDQRMVLDRSLADEPAITVLRSREQVSSDIWGEHLLED